MKKYLFYSLLAIGVCGTMGLSVASAYGHGFFGKNQEQMQEVLVQKIEAGKITEEQAQEYFVKIKDRRDEMIEAKASWLGLSAEELLSKLGSGMTFREIAEKQEIDMGELRNEMRGQMKEKFAGKKFGEGVHTGSCIE